MSDIKDEGCTHDCSSCKENCSSKKPESLIEKLNELSKVNKVIAVVSGKGGVGKSLITSLLAVNSQRRGKRTAILDADITGPSIPKIFGLNEEAKAMDIGIFPVRSKSGIEVMSINLLLEDITQPVVWRGPVIGGAVKQFWTDVIWTDIDNMFIDMPPGTGDVALTTFQSIPVDGLIIVASPQDLVSMIVIKALNMAKLMNIPVIGLIENMSYLKCPHCNEQIKLYGESHIEKVCEDFKIPLLYKMPIIPELAAQCDKGLIELYEGDYLSNINDIIDNLKKVKKGKKS